MSSTCCCFSPWASRHPASHCHLHVFPGRRQRLLGALLPRAWHSGTPKWKEMTGSGIFEAVTPLEQLQRLVRKPCLAPQVEGDDKKWHISLQLELTMRKEDESGNTPITPIRTAPKN